MVAASLAKSPAQIINRAFTAGLRQQSDKPPDSCSETGAAPLVLKERKVN
jgi:hypothetical protein